eukprot:jgi/Mesvir1/16620/Mv10154-RA.1
MFLIVSAVAIAGYLLRPPPVSRHPFSALELDDIPPPPQSLLSHPNSLGFPLVPNYTSRGGYGPGDSAYTTAPNQALGFERGASGLDLHVQPPEEHEGGVMFAPGGFPRPAMYSAPPATITPPGIPGMDVSNERQPVELSEFQGSANPDRTFPARQTWEFNVPRERDPRTAPETLNRNFNIPEPRLRVNRPNPQVAHLEQRSLPTTSMGNGGVALRAGMEHRPPIADFDPAGARLSDVYNATVLPERAATITNTAQVSDAFNDVEAPRWGCSDNSRVDPKRYDTLDALDSHPAPAGDFGVQALQFGERGIDVREPLNPKTYESRLSNAEYPNPYQSFRGDKHTRVTVNKVFEWRDGNSDLPESKEIIDNTQQVARFPKLGDLELGAVGRGAEEVSNYTAQEKNRGDRMERPGRVGVSSVQLDIGDSSNVAAYSALQTNPYYIPNINHPDS